MRIHVGIIARVAVAAAVVAALSACSSQAPVAITPSPPDLRVPEATEEVASALGSRELPFSLGESAIILELGELGGDGWSISIDSVSDAGHALVDEAIELYGDNEEYVQFSRPAEGMMFIGVTGTIERLLDSPGDPSYFIDISFVTAGGITLAPAAQSLDSSPPLMNLGEMYAPASVGFTEIFEAPIETTAQVMIDATDIGQRFYWGS